MINRERRKRSKHKNHSSFIIILQFFAQNANEILVVSEHQITLSDQKWKKKKKRREAVKWRKKTQHPTIVPATSNPQILESKSKKSFDTALRVSGTLVLHPKGALTNPEGQAWSVPKVREGENTVRPRCQLLHRAIWKTWSHRPDQETRSMTTVERKSRIHSERQLTKEKKGGSKSHCYRTRLHENAETERKQCTGKLQNII